MKRIYLLAFVLCMMIAVSSVQAQKSKVVDKIIEIGQTDNQTMNHLDVLCNRFGGRVLGSDAYENAAEWCVAQFKKWGMETELDEAGVLPVGFNRGPWFGRLLSENGMDLHFATPSYTSGTHGVQHGHVVIEPKSQADFDRMKGVLKGAWVLISGDNSGWPIDYSVKADSTRAITIAKNDSIGKVNRDIMMENRRIREAEQEFLKAQQKNPKAKRKNPKVEEKKPLPLIEEPALFYKQMREAGILGIIQSAAVPIRVLYDRKNVDKMTFETLPTVPDIKLEDQQYKIIEQMVKERRYFQLEFDIRNYFKMGPVKYYNVIGKIKGTKYPDEYVIMGGHLDCFDVASGGVDDGSGATPAMEAARLIMAAGGQPKRTILVCLWAGEEFGLLGSKSWVEKNTKNWDKISNYFNRDGGPTVANSLNVTEAMYDDFLKICEPLNSINPDFPFTLTKRTDEPRPRPTSAGGSDHAYFAMNGIPTVSFGTADTKGYDFNYGEIWHTERDMYNKSIPEYQNHTSVVTAVVVYGVANLDHLLSRKGLYLEAGK
ncbi:MAG: M20/M25/M40 family metallo-hydrolase [Porphyromonadaceae bacterium]|nr:MAG: M20/M25/M40 family metallo-hydrolase [Porphyromonadaceae bacterium]